MDAATAATEQDVLVEAYTEDRHGLLAWAYLLTGDPAAAEDLVQDAVEVVVRRARRDPEVLARPVAPFLRGIVTKLALQRRRRLLRELRRAMRLGHALPPAVEVPDETLDLLRALAGLPPRMRACAVLFYGDDRTTAEIAAMLGCSPRTVENHLRAARARLRERLRADGEDAPEGEER